MADRGAEVGRGRLWFGLLGGAAAWTAHLMLAYGIAEFGCVSGADRSTHLGLSAVTCALVAVTAATLLAAVAATLVADRSRRRLRPDADSDGDGPPAGYVAAAGLILSGTFSFVILVESVPILYYLRGC